jgi:hypothetical protein
MPPGSDCLRYADSDETAKPNQCLATGGAGPNTTKSMFGTLWRELPLTTLLVYQGEPGS